jgi:hypothetical protein
VSAAFAPVDDLVIETVDSVSGSRKTLTAVAVALDRARTGGIKTIFAMPTLQLIAEMAEVARRQHDVKVTVITSETVDPRQRKSVTTVIVEHLKQAGDGGELLFITHEAMHRMAADWPAETARLELIIDEEPETILTRAPFKLYDTWRALTSFLELDEQPVTESPGLRRAGEHSAAAQYAAATAIITERELARLEVLERIIALGPERSSPGEYAQAMERAVPLREKAQLAQRAAVTAADEEAPKLYRQLHAISLKRVRRRVLLAPVDDIYQLLHPVPAWVLQDCPVFAAQEPWMRLLAGRSGGPQRGQISICGFRRPDALKRFKRVTLMGALLRYSLAWAVWESLGVRFVPSSLVRLNQTTTWLGPRRLKIYWLTDAGWSKRLRNRSGGIIKVLEIIRAAAVIDPDAPVAVVVNKDDGSEDRPDIVRRVFPRAVILPHKVAGQNRFRHLDGLFYIAALNPYGEDIRFLEAMLGIDAHDQRIGRVGHSVYQALMRLSLRDPTGTRDVTLVVMDRDVAEWLPQWFEPPGQVEVIGIGGEFARKGRDGRPTAGTRAMTNAERQRLWRLRHHRGP